jgi:GT2 family glycosyltransferase
MSVSLDPELKSPRRPSRSDADTNSDRPRISGKFFRLGEDAFLVKGITYGTFAPAADGTQFPPPERVQGDFALMSARGLNAVRLYTPPRPEMLDEASRWGLRLMIGLPWTQHVAFLDDPTLSREIRRQIVAQVRELHQHPAALLFALGNEIPPAVVRWHGRKRVESFLRELVDEARQVAPDSYFTYVNYPPTEFLDLDFFDVSSFNVYLHDADRLRAYLARLQHIAGHKPLLLAEAGADSIREGEAGQAELTAMQIRTAFAEGACGAFAYAWTDEWWRGGREVDDWAFGLVDRQRRPKPALAAATRVFEEAPFPEAERRRWPKVSVVVCAYNAADTLDDCLSSLERLSYPNYEVILVNDGSRDDTPLIGQLHTKVQTIDVYPNGGLSAARNTGLAHATGEIVAYTDADVRVDPEWLTYLVQPFLHSDVVGSGGPNVVPPDDPWIAQCVARAPGGPTQVLLDDRVAEHVPGCNMAFRREALLAIGGFNPVFLRAGDDVDVCWRLQARGFKIGFAPAALVWHHHRATVNAYWRQQVGYGEGELWLAPHHPDKFEGRHVLWRGRIYSPLPFVRSLSRPRVNAGVWGTAAFPSVYMTGSPARDYLPHTVQWQAAWIALLVGGLAGLFSPWPVAALGALLVGLGALSLTALKCVLYARRSEVHSLPPIDGYDARRSRRRYRAMIAWLHFIQPLARLRGLVRGLLNPPDDVAPEPAAKSTGPVWLPDLGEAVSALRLALGETLSSRFWGESWAGIEGVLAGVVKDLRSARAGVVLVDDGWQHDRDVSLGLGPWSRLDLRALVEEHEGGRVLLRAAIRLRPTGPGMVVSAGIVGLLATAVAAGWGQHFPVASLAGTAGLAVAALAMLARLLRACAALQRAVARTAAAHGMAPMNTGAPVRRRWPERLAWGIRGTTAVLLLGLVSSSLSAIVQRALPAMRPAIAERTAGIAPRPVPVGGAIRPVSLTLAVARTEARPRTAPPRFADREAPIRQTAGQGVVTSR